MKYYNSVNRSRGIYAMEASHSCWDCDACPYAGWQSPCCSLSGGGYCAEAGCCCGCADDCPCYGSFQNYGGFPVCPSAGRDVMLGTTQGTVALLPIVSPVLSPINVVSATVDTCGMRASTNLINFSTMLNQTTGATTLYFQIVRKNERDGSTTNVGPMYTFQSLESSTSTQPFGFQFADVGVWPGRYTYTVQILGNSVAGATTGLSLANANLSVLAVAC